jgi:hypothetical protein
MDLDAVRRLKQDLVMDAAGRRGLRLGSLARYGRCRRRTADRGPGVVAAWAQAGPVPAAVALGIEPDGAGGHRLAVRVVRTLPGLHGVVEGLRAATAGELGVRLVGYVVPLDGGASSPGPGATPGAGLRRRVRPLVAGCSLGHRRGAAGTLGAVVVRRGGGGRAVLSCAHVLGWEPAGSGSDGGSGGGSDGGCGGAPGTPAAAGSSIVQPAAVDGGRFPTDRIALLAASALPDLRCRNRLDAAVAELVDGVAAHAGELPGLGRLAGLRRGPLAGGETVFKVGRTTGVTRGRVSAFEVDDLTVCFRRGDAVFDGAFEIEAADDRPFSLPGDSGALVVDEARRAVGLLYAGNGVDLSYAQPVAEVLDRLRVRLAT